MDFSIPSIFDESRDESRVFDESLGPEFHFSEPIDFDDSPAISGPHSPVSLQYGSNLGLYGHNILDPGSVGSGNFRIGVPRTSIGSNVPPLHETNSSLEPYCYHCGQAIPRTPARQPPQIFRRTSSGNVNADVYQGSGWVYDLLPRDSTFSTQRTPSEAAGATPLIYQHRGWDTTSNVANDKQAQGTDLHSPYGATAHPFPITRRPTEEETAWMAEAWSRWHYSSALERRHTDQDFLSMVNGTLSSKILGHGSLGLLLAGSSYVPDNCGAKRDGYRNRLTRLAEYLTLEGGTAEFLMHCDNIASTAVGNCGDRVIQGITLLKCAILGRTLQHLPPFDQYEALKGIKIREVISLYADQIGGIESTEVCLSLCFAMRQRGWNVLDYTHESLHAGRSDRRHHRGSSSWTTRSQRHELNRKLTLMVNGPREGPNKGIPDSGYIQHFLEHGCFKQVLRQTYPEDWSLVDQTRDDFNEEAIEAVQAGGAGEVAGNQLLRDFATADDRFYLNAFIAVNKNPSVLGS